MTVEPMNATEKYIALAREMSRSQEPSRAWKPLVHFGSGRHEGLNQPSEHWGNDWYFVQVVRDARNHRLEGQSVTVIAIQNDDQSARHDWRDFQRIKNDVCGDEWEAIEVYPSESCLRDPSNQFYLWAVPRATLRLGLSGGRLVLSHKESFAPQRPFAEDVTP